MTDTSGPAIGLVLDCADPDRLAAFWAPALDYVNLGNAGPYVVLLPNGRPPGPKQVPEPKTAKNRCHVDLHAESREAVHTEVDRLVGLGAAVIRDPKEEFGAYWATLEDPEGNELCVGAP